MKFFYPKYHSVIDYRFFLHEVRGRIGRLSKMTTTESAAASYGSAPGKTEYMEGSKDPVIALGANAECSDLVFEEGKFVLVFARSP